jgi:hypothetical protein
VQAPILLWHPSTKEAHLQSEQLLLGFDDVFVAKTVLLDAKGALCIILVT